MRSLGGIPFPLQGSHTGMLPENSSPRSVLHMLQQNKGPVAVSSPQKEKCKQMQQEQSMQISARGKAAQHSRLSAQSTQVLQRSQALLQLSFQVDRILQEESFIRLWQCQAHAISASSPEMPYLESLGSSGKGRNARRWLRALGFERSQHHS